MKRAISFHYRLTDSAGHEMDSSTGRKPLSFIEGMSQIIPGLEGEIIRMKQQEKRTIVVAAEMAYGLRRPELVIKVPRAKLPKADLQVGDQFRGGAETHAPIFKVTDLDATDATLDANHPLAGQDLTFDIEVVEIREATPQELEHGHVHEGGHSH